MKIGNQTLRRSLAATLLLAAASTPAQQIQDPANLTGEHVSPQSPADTLPINHGAPALQQLLLKLRTRASMMLIIAHPDDEDGGLLTYESRGQGARVAMLTLTRGEGGQNLMSADFDDALGLIRTQELLAADRYMGVDQFFGTEIDFGFSKTKEEAFAKWTHERVLYDAVRAVRLYRPLVLASVFLGAPTDGHGQHQVSGEICQEVFKAAADPNVFPEMIREGLLPWAPLKVYARVPFSRVKPEGMFDYATGKTIPTRFESYITGKITNIEPTATVQIHEGDPATILFPTPAPALGMEGLTYVQFARKGLALQKTQIGQGVRTAPPGRSDTGYTLMGSRLACAPGSYIAGCPETQLPMHEDSLFEGIDTSLRGTASLAPDAPLALREKLLQSLGELDRLLATAAFNDATPEQVVAPLHIALTELDSLLASVQTTTFDATQKFNLQHDLRIKRVQLNRAILLALGVTAESVVSSPSQLDLVPGQHFAVETALTTLAAQPLHLLSATLRIANPADYASPTIVQAQPAGDRALTANAPLRLDFEDRLPLNTPLTRPPFTHANLEQSFYNVPNPVLRNAPVAPYPLIAVVLLRDDSGDVLEIESAVVLKNSDPSGLRQSASIIPAYSVHLSPQMQALPTSTRGFPLAVRVSPSLRNARTTIAVPSGFVVHPHPDTGPGPLLEWETHSIEVTQPPSKPVVIHVTVAAPDGRTYAESYRPIGYPGIPTTNLYQPSTLRVVPIDVTTAPGLHIAYLPGTGDPLPDFLPSLGLTPTLITPADLTPDKLKQFDAILVGVRAYAAQPTLAAAGSKPLLEYARKGGVVILEYMTAKFGDAEAPYPISVPGDSAHNVVEEAEPVTLPDPAAPLLNWPNKITPADFKGWVAEYGHGFAATWSPHYQPLLEAHDVGQDPQKGGLLLAPVGKGAYIYCALALYRQLPEGVPGAYRLLANLISYAKNPKR